VGGPVKTGPCESPVGDQFAIRRDRNDRGGSAALARNAKYKLELQKISGSSTRV
jgi:hypothetical protein